jgi:phosphoribosylformylglycinamidine synthase
VWDPAWASSFAPVVRATIAPGDLQSALPALLSSANIASKEWIIRQYDHEVQGSSVVKPLHGPQSGPGDASVIRPVAHSVRGLAMGNGLATGLAADPYWMGLAAIDECVRNLVCVGTDPSRIAILDNFCWPSCKDPRNLGALVRAAHACYDGAKAYRTPFISGKDSLNNQFTTDDGTTIQIPPTLLISGFGLVHDSDHCVTMDLKGAGHALVLVGTTAQATGGSQFRALGGTAGTDELPRTDLAAGPANARAVASLIAAGHVLSAHDCSEGGLLVAAAEMAFAGDVGVQIDLGAVPGAGASLVAAFSETPSRYLLEIPMDRLDAALQALSAAGVVHARVGATSAAHTVQAGGCTWMLGELAAAWRSGGKGW